MAIVLKAGAITKFTFSNFSNLSIDISKSLDQDEMPGTTIQDYYDNVILTKGISFIARIIEGTPTLKAQIDTLEAILETSDTLYTLEININGTTKSYYVLIEKLKISWISPNELDLDCSFVVATDVIEA